MRKGGGEGESMGSHFLYGYKSMMKFNELIELLNIKVEVEFKIRSHFLPTK